MLIWVILVLLIEYILIYRTGNLIRKLGERGFSKEDIEKISYKNFLNLIDRIMKKF